MSIARADRFLDKKVNYGGQMAEMGIDSRRKAMNLYIANGFHIYETTREGDKTRTFMCVNPVDPSINGKLTKTEFDYVAEQKKILGLPA